MLAELAGTLLELSMYSLRDANISGNGIELQMQMLLSGCSWNVSWNLRDVSLDVQKLEFVFIYFMILKIVKCLHVWNFILHNSAYIFEIMFH